MHTFALEIALTNIINKQYQVLTPGSYLALSREVVLSLPFTSVWPVGNQAEFATDVGCMENILVIEDDDTLRAGIATFLRQEGYGVTETASAEEALGVLEEETFSLLLSDLMLPGKSGIEFLEHWSPDRHGTPILIMTAYGTIELAVKALQLGATDFITKPFDPALLSRTIKSISESAAAVRQITNSCRETRSAEWKSFLTQDPRVEQTILEAKKVAPLSSSVMILGESGTGKELIARYIHEQSPRADKPYVPVNCGSMPGDLLESEFFGHEVGAFTGASHQRIGLFETADGGSIFLDEIGNMPVELQMKLLRTLQESEIKRIGSSKTLKVDARVISATNCDIEARIRDQQFREDLYYRLGVVVLEIPPLRERQADIELLSHYFIKRFSQEFEQDVPKLGDGALKALKRYPWPGNVRELENVIERGMIFGGNRIEAEHLELPKSSPSSGEMHETLSLTELSSKAAKSAEVEAISQALAETGGNKSKAARMLGVSYKTLLNKVKEYALG